MATIKSYTSLEQSKVLADILPIESADMWWAERYAGKVMENGEYIVEEKPVYYLCLTKPSNDNYSQDVVNDIPCWSLAALLSILPLPMLSKDNIGKDKIGWRISVYPDNCRYDSDWYDNPIDPCYEMILKLHELKKL